jgi:ribosomal protein S18 acetylase RimI-like enzyme
MNFWEIRPFQPEMWSDVSKQLGERAAWQLEGAHWGWTAWHPQQPETAVGWATAHRLPGLPHMVEAHGHVKQANRRQGVGTALLNAAIQTLQDCGITELTCQADPTSEVAQFLHHHRFVLEHEEWEMVLPTLRRLPPVPHCQANVVTLPRPEAMTTFQTLYEKAFSGLPWYQPFTLPEIAFGLPNSEAMRFLRVDDELVGFVWVQRQGQHAVQLEPVGIVKEWQGKGYGRYLLLTVLHQLARQQIRQVTLGVWRSNETAVHLYQTGAQGSSTFCIIGA